MRDPLKLHLPARTYTDVQGHERYVSDDSIVVLCARCEGKDDDCPDCMGHFDGALEAHRDW